MIVRGDMVLIAQKTAAIEIYALVLVKTGYCAAYVKDPQNGHQYLLLGKLAA